MEIKIHFFANKKKEGKNHSKSSLTPDLIAQLNLDCRSYKTARLTYFIQKFKPVYFNL